IPSTAMQGTLPINYIKDLPPMRALAPTEPEGEEVRFDEEEAPRLPPAPRKSDPAAEISADDLVSIESVPAPSTRHPAVATLQGAAQSKPSKPRPASRPPAAQQAKTPSTAPARPRMIVPSAGSSPLAPPPMGETAPSGRRRARPWWEELFNDDFIRTMAKVTDEQIA